MPLEVVEFAKANNFTQAQLDGSINEFNKIVEGAKTAEISAIRTAGEAHIKNWGDKGKYNLNIAQRALKQLDGEGKMTELLRKSGYGNHPVVMDFLFSIGSSLSEGGFLKGSARRPPGQKTTAQKMFPNMVSKDA